MDVSFEMTLVAAAWLATTIYIVRYCQKTPLGSVGLPAAFALCMTFHYCSFFLYCVPGYTHLRLDALPSLGNYNGSDESILSGASISLVGLVAFAIGVRVKGLQLFSRRFAMPDVKSRGQASPEREKYLKVFMAIAIVGFMFPYFRASFAMAQAFQQVGQYLGVVVVSVGFWMAGLQRKRRSQLYWMITATLIPISYIIGWGMMSFGFIAGTVVIGFVLANSKSRQWSLLRLSATIVGGLYLCLSLFTVYMSSRDEIRGVIWGGAAVGDRFTVLADVFANTTLLNPFDFKSLDYVALRLNQAAFVGKTAEWHEMFPDLQNYGSTLLLGVFAWVPRALWPDKPAMGQSTMLEVNTGMKFSEDAVFGAGQVIEFYAAFGTLGVFLGFLVLGFILATIDARAAFSLYRGRFVDSIRSFTMGSAFVAPLTDVFFIISSAIASFLVITAIGTVIARYNESASGSISMPRRSLEGR